ncbi:MAG: magnesium and cobalt transport protein CorA [Rubrobacteraceae bacterium]
MILDSAIYVDGRRVAAPDSLEETYKSCRRQGGMAWVGLYEPTEEEFAAVAAGFGLHPLAMEDAISPHQRPKIEHYGDVLLVVFKSARYREEEESVEFGEIRAFLGPDFVVTVRRGESGGLADVRQKLEGSPSMLRRGPMSVLGAIMSHVVAGYGPVVDGLGNDIDEIEEDVFAGKADVSRRTYGLFREVLQFQRATKPLESISAELIEDETYGKDPEINRYLRRVRDHVLRVTEQAGAFRELLQSILNVNLTLVSVSQGEQTKKISAWAAILFFPTLITGIYGMNFKDMPELNWVVGYPYSLVLMLLSSLLAYLIFKRRGWL